MGIRIAACLLLAWLSASAFAQTFPERRITLLIGYSAGGPTDLAFRALAEAASRHLGQRVIVENKPGAAATLSGIAAMRAKPDGYTLAHVSASIVRMPHMSKVDYDPIADLTWIMGVADYLGGIVVRADAPWKTWPDLVTYAKANPNKITYATTGVGGIQHLAWSEIGQKLGIEWVMVPYKSSPEASNALLGGQVHASGGSGGWMQFVLDGRMRLLVATGDKFPKFPEVPTWMELGYGVSTRSPFGIAGPKGMDPKLVATLHDAFRQSLKDPDFLKTLERFEMNTAYLSTADYLKWARERSAIERSAIERLGLKQ